MDYTKSTGKSGKTVHTIDKDKEPDLKVPERPFVQDVSYESYIDTRRRRPTCVLGQYPVQSLQELETFEALTRHTCLPARRFIRHLIGLCCAPNSPRLPRGVAGPRRGERGDRRGRQGERTNTSYVSERKKKRVSK